MEDFNTLENNIGNENKFQVPNGYFERLPEEILLRCSKIDKKTSGFNIPVVVKWSLFAGISALIILFFLFYKPLNKADLLKTQQLTSLSDNDLYFIEMEEYDSWLLNEDIEADTGNVALPSSLNDVNTDNSDIIIEFSEEELEKIDASAILEYLEQDENFDDIENINP